MKSAAIRQAFLDYFKSKNHQIVASSSLVPGNDPTLLFTNAGMVQFKDVFLGKEKRNYVRAASSQRVVRAGGKHNDLENVGYTARHHTFFEMLGNFSFGDYFKPEAIAFAWEFVTQVLKLPPEKLWVTVFREDDEAYRIWREQIGVAADRIVRMGEKDNFWAMGDTGPCGPCTEIFYDHGPEVAGGPPGSPEEDGDRYIEIWNIVFMQYERQANGELIPLPRPSVDTGMGLERIAAVMQDVHSNYEIDLFKNLIQATADLLGVTDHSNQSLRVIADHIRSCSFLIADGVLPSNEGRGYVLRRIIRRAIRHGRKLGACEPFFYLCVEPLAKEMGEAYPELTEQTQTIQTILKREEERFLETLDQGLKILEKALDELKPQTPLPGEIIFSLYDTYGFPVDLTGDIAREKAITLDMAGFEKAMALQRARSKEAGQFGSQHYQRIEVNQATEFTGYEQLTGASEILALLNEQGEAVQTLTTGNHGKLVLGKSPFYAESGGQVGDTGVLICADATFKVENTTKNGAVFVHHGRVEQGKLKTGLQVEAQVDADKRAMIRRNHSATHLLHAALRALIGDQVRQKGSLVAHDRLRFDFSSFEPVAPETLDQIEVLINQQIIRNTQVSTETMSFDEARSKGAMALFGEKYGDEVRVLSMGDNSVELCGGTHVARTGDIGFFKIISETGIASGVRRIEAVTGLQALELAQNNQNLVTQLCQLVKSSEAAQVTQKIEQLFQQLREYEKQLEQLKAKLASQQGSDLLESVREVKGVNVLAKFLHETVDAKTLRGLLDQLKQKLGSGVILLATVSNGKIQLGAVVTDDWIPHLHAGELVNYVARQVGGKGGGKPQMAMAGGNQPEHLPEAINSVYEWVGSFFT